MGMMDKVDKTDLKIMRILCGNSKTTLGNIGKKIGIFSPSAVSKRIKGLEKSEIIRKNTVEINFNKIGLDFLTITFVKAKYSENYHNIVAEKLMSIKGIVSIYFLLGDIDFVLITLNKSKEEYEYILEQLTKIEGVERTDTRTVLRVFKEGDYDSVLEKYISSQQA
jgi:Lrp/AsnC family transcriptional regulator for asnA, asnC and gidA